MAGCHGGGRVDEWMMVGWMSGWVNVWWVHGAGWLNDARSNLGDVSLGAIVSLVSVSESASFSSQCDEVS